MARAANSCTRRVFFKRGELTNARSALVGVAETGGKALLNDFWYFSSPKSTRKEKLLYVSSRETTGLPYYPNPEFHQQPKEKLISLSAFSFAYAGAKEKAIKKENAGRIFRALRSATRTPRS